jgi:branched-chain amino acid transport system permease protein
MATAQVGVDVPALRGRGIADGGLPFLAPAIAVVVVIGLLPFVGLRFYYLQIVILVMWYAVLGTSWSIIGGYGGMHSIGHAAFVGIGAYTSTLLYVDLQLSPWLGMLAGMAVAAAVAVGIGWPCFRSGIRGDYFALVTVALGQVCYEVANGWTWLTKGSQGIAVPYAGTRPVDYQFADRSAFYFVLMAIWLVVLTVAYRVRRSSFGFQLIALRDDEAAAARGGINVAHRKLMALALSAAIAAAAGTFYAQFLLFIDPTSVFGLALSVQIVLMAVLGGMNSYLGATVGAALLVPLGQVLSSQLSGVAGLDLAIYGGILMLVVMFMPSGLLGLLRGSPRWRRVVGW